MPPQDDDKDDRPAEPAMRRALAAWRTRLGRRLPARVGHARVEEASPAEASGDAVGREPETP
jgi:hypothetical protein